MSFWEIGLVILLAFYAHSSIQGILNPDRIITRCERMSVAKEIILIRICEAVDLLIALTFIIYIVTH